MSFSRNIPVGLVNKGLQRIVLNSTATALNSTAQLGSVFLVSVETQSVRVRFDSVNSTTAPTANTGILLTAANSPYWLQSIVDPSKMKFARATAGAILQVQAFGYVSDRVGP